MDEHLMRQRMDKLVALFAKAPMKKIFGMDLAYNAEGCAVFKMPYNPNFDHALQGVHGGVFATLLDNAGWFTAAPHYETWIATVEFSTRLLEHVKEEGLIAQGKTIRVGKNLAVAEMTVHTDSGRLVAAGTGTFAPITKVSLS
jgi:acyl-CoA thioesterase